MNSASPLTEWLDQLKQGEQEAADRLWQAYYARLVRLARRKLAGTKRRVADEEDVVLAAFDTFCRGIKKGQFPRLENRNDLWQVLVIVTARKAVDQRQFERRKKRGSGRVRGESALDCPGGGHSGLRDVIGREPTPEFAVQVAEELEQMLQRLGDSSLREIALFKLEGYSNAEISDQLSCGLRTVERKLSRIRALLRAEEQ